MVPRRRFPFSRFAANFADHRSGEAKLKNLFVRKTVLSREEMPEEHRLRQSLSWPHLVALGVGAIVGTGILTLIGVGAGKAGPAVILSFAIAGVICACAALAYAEVATMIPASGSAYTYSYVVFGELIAWMIGVALILEYTLVVSAVAVGWSGYAAGFLKSVGLGLPDALIQGPELGGVINVLKKHEMPLSSYTLIHTDARLTDAQTKSLTDWVTAIRAKLPQK